MRKSLSLYVHIPFCKSKCNYCAFVSETTAEEKANAYLDSLIKEIKLKGKIYNAGYEVCTIYIGGGTPSCLPENAIKDIMHNIYLHFIVCNDAEITIEINPNSLTKQKVQEYLEVGINRFSIGLQSANPKLLKIIGRTHTAEDFVKSVNLLKSMGATNISSDLMLGLPTQTTQDVIDSINFMANLGVKHISAYMLSIEEGTKFYELNKAGLLNLPSENEVVKQYNACYKTLKEKGFNRYEFSNFAMDGYKSKHNQIYWNRKEYIGFGVSAHSYINGYRMANISNISQYIYHIQKDEFPLEFKEEITKQEAKEETIMLSLRLEDGLDLYNYQMEFGTSLLAEKKAEITELVKNKFLIIDKNNHLKATNKGFLVMDKIISILT